MNLAAKILEQVMMAILVPDKKKKKDFGQEDGAFGVILCNDYMNIILIFL